LGEILVDSGSRRGECGRKKLVYRRVGTCFAGEMSSYTAPFSRSARCRGNLAAGCRHVVYPTEALRVVDPRGSYMNCCAAGCIARSSTRALCTAAANGLVLLSFDESALEPASAPRRQMTHPSHHGLARVCWSRSDDDVVRQACSQLVDTCTPAACRCPPMCSLPCCRPLRYIVPDTERWMLSILCHHTIGVNY